MHEYSITKNIIDIVIKEANKENATKVTEITLVIGDLSSIMDESVQMYFDIISKGTIVNGAKLIFKRKSVDLICSKCNKLYKSRQNDFSCPICSAMGIPKGNMKDEFYIESIDIL